MPKKRTFDRKKEIRAIARERIGAPPPARPLEERSRVRKKPKHKKPITEEPEQYPGS